MARILIRSGLNSPVDWYRFKHPLSHMKGHKVVELDDDLKDIEDVADWVRENGVKWDIFWTNDYRPEIVSLGQAFQANGTRFVAEIDDWFEDVPQDNPASMAWIGRRVEQYQGLLEAADSICASTPPLAERYGGTLCPNFIEPAEWRGPRRKKPDGEVVILVAAGMGRSGDMQIAAPALQAALAKPHVKVVFMGVFPDWALTYPTGKVVWCRWAPIDTYPKLVNWMRPDIMISPMHHHDFNRAKSNLKWLEAGASGAAFLGERWGEYARTCVDGETAVLAEGQQEWTDALTELCENSAFRGAVAKAGRRAVLEGWTWRAHADAWTSAVLGGSHGSSRKRPLRSQQHGSDGPAPGRHPGGDGEMRSRGDQRPE